MLTLTKAGPGVILAGAGPFTPTDLPNLAAWFRFNQGITVTGSGVSQWNDASGNARHLLQATDASRPPLQGDGSILFDGSAQFMSCTPFTFTIPETIYLLFRQISWTIGDGFWDGNATGSGYAGQFTATPTIRAFNGVLVGETADLALNTYGSVCVVFGTVSSLIQVNNNAPVVGSANANDMNGFWLGRRANIGTNSNIQVKECLLYSAEHDAGQRAQVINYLNSL